MKLNNLTMSFALLVSATLIAGANVQARPVGEALNPTECSDFTNSNVLKIAVNNVLSIGYVRHAVESALAENSEGSKICYSGVAFHKNAFQYYQYLIQLEVRSAISDELTHRFQLLYQDASTQANHNITQNAWVGLDSEVVAENYTEGFSDLVWSDITEETKTAFLLKLEVSKLMELSPLGRAALKKSLRTETISAIPFEFGATSGFLMTWMRPVGEGYMAINEIPEGIVLRIDYDSGMVEMADLTWVQTRLLKRLQENIYSLSDKIKYQDYAQELLKMSRQK